MSEAGIKLPFEDVVLPIEEVNRRYSNPRTIAKITLCGSFTMCIDENNPSFIRPTPEQIKNLKENFCIDVELLDEEKTDEM